MTVCEDSEVKLNGDELRAKKHEGAVQSGKERQTCGACPGCRIDLVVHEVFHEVAYQHCPLIFASSFGLDLVYFPS